MPDPVREETGGDDDLTPIDGLKWRCPGCGHEQPAYAGATGAECFECDHPTGSCQMNLVDELAASASSFKEEGSDRRERAYEAALEEYGTLDALVQQHPDQHVALLRDAVDAALGVMAYTGPLKPPAPSVSQQETGEHLRTRACPTHGNLHVAPTGIEPIDRCPVLCVSGEECGELLGPTRTWHPAPSQQEGGGDA